jgi:hypothetical protein
VPRSVGTIVKRLKRCSCAGFLSSCELPPAVVAGSATVEDNWSSNVPKPQQCSDGAPAYLSLFLSPILRINGVDKAQLCSPPIELMEAIHSVPLSVHKRSDHLSPHECHETLAQSQPVQIYTKRIVGSDFTAPHTAAHIDAQSRWYALPSLGDGMRPRSAHMCAIIHKCPTWVSGSANWAG